jgi:glycosyltransferase involved in cell wall biosynthesis
VAARAPADGAVTRTLMIAPTPFFGDRGCHVRILEEVRALARHGIESEIATYPTGRDLDELTIRRASNVPGVRAQDLGPSYGRVALDASLLATAMKTMRRFRPHVIHAHLHEGIAVGAVLRRSFRIPLVGDLQGSLTEELIDHRFLGPRGAVPALVRRMERWLVRRPDRVLVSARATASLLAEQGVDPHRIEWLPDGVDLEQFHPMLADVALQDRFGLRNKQVIVFLGVLTAYQGVDLLLEAVPLVVRHVPDAHFLIMGYPHEEEYRRRVHTEGLSACVSLTGRIPYDQAGRYLTLGTVAVSPKQSLTEANGKLLNYMACGLATVASDTPVNRDALGEAGLYAPVGSASTLACRLVELLQDPVRRVELGHALRRRAETHFSWPALSHRLVDVYERVAQEGLKRVAG